jgi:hypothetical protein
MEIDPPDATTRFQHRLKQYYKWTDEFAARTLDGFWRYLRILTLVVKLWCFVISDGLSSPELRRRLNQSSVGQGDVFRVGSRPVSVAASARSEAVADYPAGALERRKVKLNIEMPEPPRSRMPRYLRAHYGRDAGNEALKQETRPTPVDMEE